METVSDIAYIALGLGFTPLNIALAVMLYFVGAHSGIFPKFWGKKDDDDNTPATKTQMERLANYYNHDTTEILHSINDNIKSVHATLEKVEDAVHVLHTTHAEWEKYGIPTRPPKM